MEEIGSLRKFNGDLFTFPSMTGEDYIHYVYIFKTRKVPSVFRKASSEKHPGGRHPDVLRAGRWTRRVDVDEMMVDSG